jgi:hypothetical protein
VIKTFHNYGNHHNDNNNNENFTGKQEHPRPQLENETKNTIKLTRNQAFGVDDKVTKETKYKSTTSTCPVDG